MTIQVICFDDDEKPLRKYILRCNNFGLIYEISKDAATARIKNGNFPQHPSHLMPPIQQTLMNIGITLISSQNKVFCATFPLLVV